MIRSFKHRGLKRLYEKGDPSLIRQDLLKTVREILTLLDAATKPQDLNLVGYRLHPLRRQKGLLGRDRARKLANCFRL